MCGNGCCPKILWTASYLDTAVNTRLKDIQDCVALAIIPIM